MNVLASLDAFLAEYGGEAPPAPVEPSGVCDPGNLVWKSMQLQSLSDRLAQYVSGNQTDDDPCPIASEFSSACVALVPSIKSSLRESVGILRPPIHPCKRLQGWLSDHSLHPSVSIISSEWSPSGIEVVSRDDIAAGTVLLDEQPVPALTSVDPLLSAVLSPNPSVDPPPAAALADDLATCPNAFFAGATTTVSLREGAPCARCCARTWRVAPSVAAGGACPDVVAAVMNKWTSVGVGGVDTSAARITLGAPSHPSARGSLIPYCSRRCADADTAYALAFDAAPDSASHAVVGYEALLRHAALLRRSPAGDAVGDAAAAAARAVVTLAIAPQAEPDPLFSARHIPATWRPASVAQWAVAVATYATTAVACAPLRRAGGVRVYRLGDLLRGAEGAAGGADGAALAAEARALAETLPHSGAVAVVRPADGTFVPVGAAPPSRAAAARGGEAAAAAARHREKSKCVCAYCCVGPTGSGAGGSTTSFADPAPATTRARVIALSPRKTAIPVFVFTHEWLCVIVNVSAPSPLTRSHLPPTFATYLWAMSLSAGTATAVGQPAAGTAVYAIHALLGHACAPNAVVSAHTSARMRVLAVAPITVGDSVGLSFVHSAASAAPPGADAAAGALAGAQQAAPTAARAAVLARGWGIDECRCETCAYEGVVAVAAAAVAQTVAASAASRHREDLFSGVDVLVPFTSHGPSAVASATVVAAFEAALSTSANAPDPTSILRRDAAVATAASAAAAEYKLALLARRAACIGDADAAAAEAAAHDGADCACVYGPGCPCVCVPGFLTTASSSAAPAPAPAAPAAAPQQQDTPPYALLAPSTPIPWPSPLTAATATAVATAAHAGVPTAQLIVGLLLACGAPLPPYASAVAVPSSPFTAARNLPLAARWFANAAVSASTAAALRRGGHCADTCDREGREAFVNAAAVDESAAAVALWALGCALVAVGTASPSPSPAAAAARAVSGPAVRAAPTHDGVVCLTAAAATHCAAAASALGLLAVAAAAVGALAGHHAVQAATAAATAARGGSEAAAAGRLVARIAARPAGAVVGSVGIDGVNVRAVGAAAALASMFTHNVAAGVKIVSVLSALAGESATEAAEANAAGTDAAPSTGANGAEALHPLHALLAPARVAVATTSRTPRGDVTRTLRACVRGGRKATVGAVLGTAPSPLVAALSPHSGPPRRTAATAAGAEKPALAPSAPAPAPATALRSAAAWDEATVAGVAVVLGAALEARGGTPIRGGPLALTRRDVLVLFRWGVGLLEVAEGECQHAAGALSALASCVEAGR